LHLVTTLNPGGIERWLLSMLQEVDRGRVAMDICCKGSDTGSLASQAEALGASVYQCPLHPTHVGFIMGLRKIIRAGNYQIVHNHLETYAGAGTYAAKRCRIPVITSFHNTSFPAQSLPDFPFLYKLRDIYGRLGIGYALRHSELVTCCSQSVLDNLKQEHAFSPGREKVIYYGVKVFSRMPRDQRVTFRFGLGIGKDRLLISHVGRFLPQKNHAGLVRVAEKVIGREARAHFVLVGDGPLRASIERMVQERSLTSSFSFLGLRQDVEDILRCSDLLFFPSHWEGLGLVVLEAMAAGLPVVASDLPVFKETVADSESGYLWPVLDEEGLAQKLLGLLADPEKRYVMGETGRRIVEAKFSLQTSARKLCELYESLDHP
jgi:glycosyltransferase involved in cell wall biosynthesis